LAVNLNAAAVRFQFQVPDIPGKTNARTGFARQSEAPGEAEIRLKSTSFPVICPAKSCRGIGLFL
jgi:hypothetical protein